MTRNAETTIDLHTPHTRHTPQPRIRFHNAGLHRRFSFHPGWGLGTWIQTAGLMVVLAVYAASTQAQTSEKPTDQIDDAVSSTRLPTGRTISPAGDSTEFYGRPVDLEVAPDGSRAWVKDWKSLRVIDAGQMKVDQTLDAPGGASLYGIAQDSRGHIFFTNTSNGLHEFTVDADGQYVLARTIELPDNSFPCGVALSDDDKTAFVCLSKRNSLAIVDLVTGTVRQEIPVGVAPFDVCLNANGNRIFVSNLGGDRPEKDDRTAPSADTETRVDERGIADGGSVSVIDAATTQVLGSVSTGLQSSVLLPVESHVVVCNANQDSVSVIDTARLQAVEVVVKPDLRLAFGSMPNALAYDPESGYLFVALAGNNAVAVMDWQQVRQFVDSRLDRADVEGTSLDQNNPDQPIGLLGLIPTGWFPSGLQCDKQHLFIVNNKGVGSRTQRRDPADGRNSHDHRGSVQRVSLQQIRDAEQLARWTQQALTNSRIPVVLANRPLGETERDENVQPRPIPRRTGDPSVFRHVIYVIKENRTFDQVFGDFAEARSDESLCTFPEEVTPNHHALARRFGILDNYYCNGVLSADGHSWATEGNVTPYLERAFGGFVRSYTFGDDPLTYSSSGFVWDHVLAAGLSFRNYGEMDYATPPEGMKYQEIWNAYKNGQPIEFAQNIGIERLRRYSCRDYPGWNMVIPDNLRMDRFLKEFREFEKDGNLPNLTIVYLPQDHLGGGVTGRAHMADNDLALGRLVEAVSRSRFWKETVIFVNEDDPQNGFDHIDGHRSICLVISPYSRPGVNHRFYNQTSVLRTILHILGLPPMNQQDASAPLMRDCFSDELVNVAPYESLKSNIELNETPPPPEQQSELERQWRSRLATVPIERTGMKTPQDEDTLNRFIWHEARGWTTPYPEQWAGAHGRGLRELGLLLDPEAQDD